MNLHWCFNFSIILNSAHTVSLIFSTNCSSINRACAGWCWKWKEKKWIINKIFISSIFHQINLPDKQQKYINLNWFFFLNRFFCTLTEFVAIILCCFFFFSQNYLLLFWKRQQRFVTVLDLFICSYQLKIIFGNFIRIVNKLKKKKNISR